MEYTPERRISFGSRVHGYIANKMTRTAGGGGGGMRQNAGLNVRWHDKFIPPKNYTTKARVVPGRYTGLDGQEYEFFQYVQFYSARTGRNFVGSGKYEMRNGRVELVDGECLGWDEFMQEIKEGKDREHRSISMRVMHAFTIVHLEYYHLVPQVDEHGNPIVYAGGKREGEPIIKKELCIGRKCPLCADKVERVYGKKAHWSLGIGHLAELCGVEDEIGKDCTNCGGSKTIETITWDCEKCGEILVRAEDFNVRVKEESEQLQKLTGGPLKCNKCGHTGTLLTQYECTGCKDPSPLSIFDCDIEIKRQGEGTKSSIQIPRWTHTELSDELKEMATPYNFSEIFFPDPMDIQAKLLKVTNTHGKADAPKAYANYK